jgi:Domain of unknown function (DUF4276)
MHIEFLIEDYSGGEALKELLPSCLAPETQYQIRNFSGKSDLLKKLPDRLKGYKAWIPDDYLIVVLIDRDDQDCVKLKQQLEDIATNAGFITKTKNNGHFQVLNRIMIEELESWFFGDVDAIVKAYPGVKASLAQQEKYRDPDAIQCGTWEALERILQRARHHQRGLDKAKAARDIAQCMNPEINRSKSFQVFYEGLKAWQKHQLSNIKE